MLSPPAVSVSLCINRLHTSSWGKSSTTHAQIARWNPVVGAFGSDMLDVTARLACVAFLIPAADRRISAILQSSVVASSSDLVDCAAGSEDADVSWLPLSGAFGFVTSFEFVLFEGFVDDGE